MRSDEHTNDRRSSTYAFDATLGFPGEGPRGDEDDGKGLGFKPRNATEVKAEREKRRTEKLRVCHICKQSGHVKKDCPTKGRSAKEAADALDPRNVPAIDPVGDKAKADAAAREKAVAARAKADAEWAAALAEARFRARQSFIGKNAASADDVVIMRRRAYAVVAKLTTNPNFQQFDFRAFSAQLNTLVKESMATEIASERSRVIRVVDVHEYRLLLAGSEEVRTITSDEYCRDDGAFLSKLKSLPDCSLVYVSGVPTTRLIGAANEEFIKLVIALICTFIVVGRWTPFTSSRGQPTWRTYSAWIIDVYSSGTFWYFGMLFSAYAAAFFTISEIASHTGGRFRLIVFIRLLSRVRSIEHRIAVHTICTMTATNLFFYVINSRAFEDYFSSIGARNVGWCWFAMQILLCTLYFAAAFIASAWTSGFVHYLHNSVVHAFAHYDLMCDANLPYGPYDPLVMRIRGFVNHAIDMAHYYLPAPRQQVDVSITYGDFKTSEPRFGTYSAVLVAGATPTVFDGSSEDTVRSAFEHRVGKELPAHVDEATYKRIVQHTDVATKPIIEVLASKIKRVNKAMNRRRWLSRYPPKRRAALMEAYANPVVRNLKQPVASSFIKVEKALKPTSEVEHLGNVFKAPRFIQGCPLELTNECGPWLVRLAKNVREGLRPQSYDASDIHNGRHILYTCGLTGDEIGNAYGRMLDGISATLKPGEKVVILEDDQSRFDLHLLEGSFRYLSRVYARFLPRRIARLLARSKKSRGRMANGTKYQVPWTMQSGWPDTSLGDTLVNVAMKMHIHRVGARWFSIVCGDDSITVMVDADLAALGGTEGITERYSEFGMEVEAKASLHTNDVEFCSGRFMSADNTFILVPKIGKTIGRIFSDCEKRSPKRRKEWLLSICATLTCYSRFCVFFGDMAKAISNDIGCEPTTPTFDQYKIPYHRGRSVSMIDQLDHLDAHYGMSEREFNSIRTALSQIRVGDVITHPLVVDLVERDI